MTDLKLIEKALDNIARHGDMKVEIEARELERICDLAMKQVKNCSIPDVGQSLPDAEQCLKIQDQVKQYCYTDQDDKPVISSGGIRAIVSRWKQMVG